MFLCLIISMRLQNRIHQNLATISEKHRIPSSTLRAAESFHPRHARPSLPLSRICGPVDDRRKMDSGLRRNDEPIPPSSVEIEPQGGE